MKRSFILGCFFISLLFIISISLKAQKRTIGIVFDADTTLVLEHVGLTIFNNKTNPLPINISISQYIENKLLEHLGNKYEVSICKLPDSLQHVSLNIFEEGGIGKKLTKWAKSKKDEYDIVLFIRNENLSNILYNFVAQRNSSGIYSRKNRVSLYSSITFFAYMNYIPKPKLLNYTGSESVILKHLKGFKLPKDKSSLPPEMLDFIKYEFEKYLDSRIEHYIIKTSLLGPNQKDTIKDDIYD